MEASNNLKDATLMKQLLITCFISGCLEMYDFAIFGILANVLKKNYLNFLSQESGVIAAWLLFAVGFVFRPIGSMIFGYIGDSYGRRIALIISVVSMGIASLGMAVLPTYDQIGGIYACWILVILRIVQGVSIGGEYMGSVIFAIEHSPRKMVGFIGGIISGGAMCGILLATLVGNLLKMPGLPEYSWRFAFLFGVVVAIMGFIIRVRFSETPTFKKMISAKYTNRTENIITKISNNYFKVLTTVAVAGASGVNVYFLSIYLPNFIQSKGMNLGWVASFATCWMAILIPTFGALSDKFSPTRMMIISGIAVCILAFPLNMVIYGTESYTAVIFMIAIHAFFLTMFFGPLNTFVVQMFDPNVRYTCSALSYSIGMGVVGGTSPMVASILNQFSGNNPLYLSSYISFVSFLGVVMVIFNEYKSSSSYTSKYTL